MSKRTTFALAFALGLCAIPVASTAEPASQTASPIAMPQAVADDERGFRLIFDGKSLAGWDGPPGFWSVQDGAIVGTSTRAHPSGVNFLIWRGGQPSNFELKLELRLVGAGGSGVQYRSWTQPYPVLPPLPPGQSWPPMPGGGTLADLFNPLYEKWNMAGYQFDVGKGHMGGAYEGGGGTARGYVAMPGRMIREEQGQPPKLLATFDIAALDQIKPEEWHTLHLIARGNVLIQIVDGLPSTVVVDEDPSHSRAKGLIGLQLETTGDATVYARNIRLKELK